MGRVIALINSAEVLPISFFVFGRWPGALTRLPAVTCDRDCDKDTPERADHGGTGRDCMMSSAEARDGGGLARKTTRSYAPTAKGGEAPAI